MVSSTGFPEVDALLNSLSSWTASGYTVPMTLAARGVSEAVQASISNGEDSDGASLAPLAQSTLQAPIRLVDDSSIRSTWGDTPLHATGKLKEDIVSEKINDNEWEIGAYSGYGEKILSSNAKRSHSGIPFGGDTPKPVRDVLTVSEKHLDIIENNLVNDITRLLGL